MCWVELHVHGNIEQLNANFFGIKMQLHHDQVLKEILVIAIAIIAIYFCIEYHNYNYRTLYSYIAIYS